MKALHRPPPLELLKNLTTSIEASDNFATEFSASPTDSEFSVSSSYTEENEFGNLNVLASVANALADDDPKRGPFIEEPIDKDFDEIQRIMKKMSLRLRETDGLKNLEMGVAKILKMKTLKQEDLSRVFTVIRTVKLALCHLEKLERFATNLGFSRVQQQLTKTSDRIINFCFVKFTASFVSTLQPSNIEIWNNLEVFGNDLNLRCRFKHHICLNRILRRLKVEREKAHVKVLKIMAILIAETRSVNGKTVDVFLRLCKPEDVSNFNADLSLVDETIIKPLEFIIKVIFFLDCTVDRKEFSSTISLKKLAEFNKHDFFALQCELDYKLYQSLDLTNFLHVMMFVNDQEWFLARTCHLCLVSLKGAKGCRGRYFSFCSKTCYEAAWHNRIVFKDTANLLAKFKLIFNAL